MTERISSDDLQVLNIKKQNLEMRKMEEGRAAAFRETASLDVQNTILRLYIKYNIRPGVDSLSDDGNIVRANVEPALVDAATEAQTADPTPEPEPSPAPKAEPAQG